MKLRKSQYDAYKMIGLQCVLVLIVAMVCDFYHIQWSKDVLLGGVAAILPNVFFAHRLFTRVYRKKNPGTALYSLLLQKMTFSIILLLLMLTQLTTSAVILLGGFLSAYVGLWLSPLLLYLMSSD